MANTGTLRITLHGVHSLPAADPATRVSIMRASDGHELLIHTHSFPPPLDVVVPAFPTEHLLFGHITPERYRSRELPFFTLTHDETIDRKPTVFRTPSQWKASFTKWADLPDRFAPLRRVLRASKTLRVRGGRELGTFINDRYDDIDASDRATRLAKTSMLNLFAKLQDESDPVAGSPWFASVQSLLEIDRERFIAMVGDTTLRSATHIRENLKNFPRYKTTPVGDHHKNIPVGFTVRKSDIVSIKTREEHGNVQLTISPATAPNGSSVVLLDADIDENGKLMKHLADLFKHRFNGGTHPYDIHEYLILETPSRALGYVLI